jgi:hypothetical protein
MDRKQLSRNIAIPAVILSFAGVWLTYMSWGVTIETTRFIRSKTSQLEALQKMSGARQGSKAGLATLEREITGPPPELERAVDRLLQDTDAELQPGAATPISGAWMHRESTLRIPAVSVESLGRFIAVIESESPPWRLRECSVVSLPQQPGTVRADLTLETVERRE